MFSNRISIAGSSRNKSNVIRIFGIDFTSRPTQRKAITCAEAELDGDRLTVHDVIRWHSFEPFEHWLASPGPWVAALDFPFGQATRFIRNAGWPSRWSDYVRYTALLSRDEFRQQMDDYRKDRAPGDKEHKRSTDRSSGASSPQKIYGVPVGLMFYEGAPRLLQSGVNVAGVHKGDLARTVVEAYPGALARYLVGRASYKNDDRSKQNNEQQTVRARILGQLRDGALLESHGISVIAPGNVISDPGADDLDAVLCAVQAAAAWLRREEGFGAPEDLDKNEGWIAEPTLYA